MIYLLITFLIRGEKFNLFDSLFYSNKFLNYEFARKKRLHNAIIHTKTISTYKLKILKFLYASILAITHI